MRTFVLPLWSLKPHIGCRFGDQRGNPNALLPDRHPGAEDASAVALRFPFDPPPHALIATQASAPARPIAQRLIDRDAFG
jgi:hypothetical protein